MEAPFSDQRLISVTNEELKRFTKSLDMVISLNEFFNDLRQTYKYSNNKVAVEHAEKWRDVLISILNDRGVDLDDLL